MKEKKKDQKVRKRSKQKPTLVEVCQKNMTTTRKFPRVKVMISQIESSHQVPRTKDREVPALAVGSTIGSQERKMPKDNVKGYQVSLRAKD